MRREISNLPETTLRWANLVRKRQCAEVPVSITIFSPDGLLEFAMFEIPSPTDKLLTKTLDDPNGIFKDDNLSLSSQYMPGPGIRFVC